MSAPDLPEMQVAIDLDESAFRWCWRCKEVRWSDFSTWVGSTTDLELEVIELVSHVVVMSLSAPIPNAVRGELHPGRPGPGRLR